MKRKGLILAGGEGTRLYPSTRVVSKHLLPVFNKPMIYYSLATMIAAKIDEIAIIIKPEDRLAYTKLLGDGSDFGVSIHFIEQENPNGLPEAYILAESFLDGKPSVLLLGDNIYFGEGLSEFLVSCGSETSSATIVGYKVSDPERFGVIEFDEDGIVKNLEEKPVRPKSDYAVTGIYFLDGDAPRFAKTLVPSNRGEIEIVDLP